MDFHLSKEVIPYHAACDSKAPAFASVRMGMTNDILRAEYNRLTMETFGFSFEDWYQNGYWSEFHMPYTLFQEGKAIANVSVNKQEILWREKVYHCIQLGTIMTDRAYRNQGLSRILMEEVKHDWEGKCDAMFLFANESVLDFYPRFGFERKAQYQFCAKPDRALGLCKKLDMNSQCDREFLKAYYEKRNPFSEMQVIHNFGLLMFYCCSFMKDCVYYSQENDAVVIMEQEDGVLQCYDIFCDKGKNMMDILSCAAAPGTKMVRLGFTPCEKKCFEVTMHDDPDDALFVLRQKGREICDIGEALFPVISHT